MQQLDVSPEVWERILDVRAGLACLCCGNWSAAEAQALALYGAVAQPPESCQVFAQIGQSLDGRIATEAGDAKDVSGEDGLAHLHRLRALADAVVIGVKTALHDDPQLTVRLARGTNPARVVIDPDGRLPDDARLLADTSARRIIIQAVARDRPAGVEVITLSRSTRIEPADILAALSERGFKSILIEGGGITITHFLEAGLLNRLHVAIAPLLIGSGPQSLTTAPIGTLAKARRPQMEVYNLGSDVVFDCTLSPTDARPIAAARCSNALNNP